MTHLDFCKSNTNSTKNTGAYDQCFEGLLEKVFVSKKDFRFASIADFKDISVWKTAIKNKDIVPLYDAYEVAPANVESKKFESGNFAYVTEKAIKKTTFECFLGFCSHKALRSYENSEYTQLFEWTQEGVMIGVGLDDGKVKGQEVTLAVDIRTIQVAAKVPFTKVTVTYKDYEELEDNPVGVRMDWNAQTDLSGIYDLTLEKVSFATNEFKFTASAGCAGGDKKVSSLLATDFIVRDTTGAIITFSFIGADSEGIYTVTSNVAIGNTIELNGVVDKTIILYESPEPLTMTS